MDSSLIAGREKIKIDFLSIFKNIPAVLKISGHHLILGLQPTFDKY